MQIRHKENANLVQSHADGLAFKQIKVRKSPKKLKTQKETMGMNISIYPIFMEMEEHERRVERQSLTSAARGSSSQSVVSRD